MGIAEAVIAAVAPHPAIRSIELVGSRADGRAHERSDWDFRVEAHDFARAAEALPALLEPLRPLVQQWDRLSESQCLMLILRGPTKVDLIFALEPHEDEPPWTPSAASLSALDAHFWDWMLWLGAKRAGGHTDLIRRELDKLFAHLLAPLGAESTPSSLGEAVSVYRALLRRAERRFGVTVDRELAAVVMPALADDRRSQSSS